MFVRSNLRNGFVSTCAANSYYNSYISLQKGFRVLLDHFSRRFSLNFAIFNSWKIRNSYEIIRLHFIFWASAQLKFLYLFDIKKYFRDIVIGILFVYYTLTIGKIQT